MRRRKIIKKDSLASIEGKIMALDQQLKTLNTEIAKIKEDIPNVHIQISEDAEKRDIVPKIYPFLLVTFSIFAALILGFSIYIFCVIFSSDSNTMSLGTFLTIISFLGVAFVIYVIWAVQGFFKKNQKKYTMYVFILMSIGAFISFLLDLKTFIELFF